MIIGCLFLPTGFITKPTPYLWKAFGGISFFYLSVLIYFLYLVNYSNYSRTNNLLCTLSEPTLIQILDLIIIKKSHMFKTAEFMLHKKKIHGKMSHMLSLTYLQLLTQLVGSLRLLFAETLN